MKKNSGQYNKVILGLKIRLKRMELGLSYAQLSSQTGISISYLNEIEKGKKAPKQDKVIALAEAFNCHKAELEDKTLEGSLKPLGELLDSKFLEQLPLDQFGIDLAKISEMIALAPLKVGAFISTLLEISINNNLKGENFYNAALRSYMELNHNYFEDIEKSVLKLTQKDKQFQQIPISVDAIANTLTSAYNYKIVYSSLNKIKYLENMRSIYIPEKNMLMLNSKLNAKQKRFQLGKELGFVNMKLIERSYVGSLLKVNSFDEVLNHYKAGYFSTALLIPARDLISDLKTFFAQTIADASYLKSLIQKYDVTPETLIQRFTNILPSTFDIKNLFFHRFVQDLETGYIKMDREFHIGVDKRVKGVNQYEHYCRRWLSNKSLEKMLNEDIDEDYQYNLGIVNYQALGDSYLCFTIARSTYPTIGQNAAVTLGIKITPPVRERIKFIDQLLTQETAVNTTCERCNITDCQERAVEPIVLLRREKRKKVNNALEKFIKKQL